MKGIKIEISPHYKANIKDVCESAKVLSEYLGYDLEFRFNGVKISTENKSINEMVERYMTHGSYHL